MSTIVPTLSHALNNIERFSEELDKSVELQRRLAFARAWYAHQTKDGTWLFAPSKFAGYKDMTAEEYINGDQQDGRRTEKQLHLWFRQVFEKDDIYSVLSEGLASFLSRYGKPPSSAFRISVTNDFYQNHVASGSDASEQMIADLLIAVAQRLPAAERARVRAAL